MLSRLRQPLFHALSARRAVPLAPSKAALGRLGVAVRSLSTAPPSDPKPSEEEPKPRTEVVKMDYDDYDDYEPKTAGEKVRAYTTLGLRLGLLAAIGVLAAYMVKELFPGRMSPQSAFSEVFDYLRYKEQIIDLVGDNPKAFGRDVGRNTEGRRNFVDSFTYKASDGSNRVRIRFNIKGDRGQVLVWAELSDNLRNDEYVYVIVQSYRTGEVYTIVDNRDAIAAGMMGGQDTLGIRGMLSGKLN